MLHGCGQDPDVFAHDTRMNALADVETFLVVYPEQSATHNRRKCWNWFDPAHQTRAAGEPAEIVAIVDAVSAEFPVDQDRIYVAGLSAGAAMAVVLGATYPDRFAAIGVCAGLPYQAADDCFGGLTLMQRIGDRLTAGEWYGPWQDYWLAYVMCWAASPSVPPSPRLSPLADPKTLGTRVADAMGEHRRIVPMILFQGTGDVTVKPANGEALVAQWAQIGDLGARERRGAAADEVTMTTEQGAVRDGRSYTLTTCRDANGKVLIRAYEVEGMGHSWSGGAPAGAAGDAAGPLTDPLGPDATRLMWAFFRTTRCRRNGAKPRPPGPPPQQRPAARAAGQGYQQDPHGRPRRRSCDAAGLDPRLGSPRGEDAMPRGRGIHLTRQEPRRPGASRRADPVSSTGRAVRRSV